MKLQKRIKHIVAHTVEDFYNGLRSTNESPEELKAWLCDALMQDEDIEDLHTYEVSFKVLEMLNSLDMVDLESIHKTLLKRDKSVQSIISFIFDEVVG
jgi:hypothetical protein